jgi:hypothetical protein
VLVVAALRSAFGWLWNVAMCKLMQHSRQEVLGVRVTHQRSHPPPPLQYCRWRCRVARLESFSASVYRWRQQHQISVVSAAEALELVCNLTPPWGALHLLCCCIADTGTPAPRRVEASQLVSVSSPPNTRTCLHSPPPPKTHTLTHTRPTTTTTTTTRAQPALLQC